MFYIYKHKRITDGTVFYIGKGKGNRAHSSKNRNTHWKRIVAKDGGFDSEIVKDGLSEDEAFNLEVKLISEVGLDNLCNMTEGGSGGDTRVNYTSDEYDEWLKKKSKAQSGKVGYWAGKKRPEHSKRISEIASSGVYKNNGKWKPSDETRKKMSESAKVKPPRVVCEYCNKDFSIKNIAVHQKSKKCLGNSK
jgi:hypothetical protein